MFFALTTFKTINLFTKQQQLVSLIGRQQELYTRTPAHARPMRQETTITTADSRQTRQNKNNITTSRKKTQQISPVNTVQLQESQMLSRFYFFLIKGKGKLFLLQDQQDTDPRVATTTWVTSAYSKSSCILLLKF